MGLKLRVNKSHNNPLNYFGSFVILGTLVAFFGFHSLAGERGLLVLDNLDRKIASAQEHLYLLEKNYKTYCRKSGSRQFKVINY